ncbi:MAG: hypothetical protein ACI3ZY_11990 [Parabacteroides sp.]
MRAIHLFNPGYEVAVLSGQVRYTPPVNVQIMRRDLATLPLWYADPGDLVWCEDEEQAMFVGMLPTAIRPLGQVVMTKSFTQWITAGTVWRAQPWGLSPDSLCRMAQLAQQVAGEVRGTVWKADYRRLTGRQTAAVCFSLLRTLLPEVEWPQVPTFCSTLEEVNTCVSSGKGPYVLKTPFSSSGRGLLWCMGGALGEKEKAWAQGAIRKQGAISVERGLDKVLDFAMEFQVEEMGAVRYEGLSIFETAERGAYTGNRLASETLLRQTLLNYVEEPLFEQVKQTLTQLLKQLYAPYYQGYIGVDMLIYQTVEGRYAWHPCVEINMRCTMGLVALKLTQRLLAEQASGLFQIAYQKEAGEAYRLHQEAQAAHPLCVEAGRIKKGYLSLCPVTLNTHYRAYLLIP